MRTIFHEKFVVDEHGKRTAVLIDAKAYEKILRILQEAEVLRIVREGEREYRQGRLKPIRSLADLNK